MVISWFKSVISPERTRVAHALYVAAVEQARHPEFYIKGQVADSLDGRFDLIVLHLWLIVARLHRPSDQEIGLSANARALEEKLLDVYFADMDQSLREMGVGDLGVSKKVKVMAQAFCGRAEAYDEAFAQLGVAALNASGTAAGTGQGEAFDQALVRNVYRDVEPEPAALRWLVEYVVAARILMDEQSLAKIVGGAVEFPALAAQEG